MNTLITDRDSEIEQNSLKIFASWPRTKIVFGSGMLKEAGKYAREFGTSALIVIGGGSVKKNGFLDILIAALDNAGLSAKIFEGVEENPLHETIQAIAQLYTQNKFDVLIGLGGGSALDAAKAALILASLKETDLSPYFGVGEVSKKLPRISPCICIPTTSGTSSEVTRYSNITVRSLGVKKLISDIAIHPHIAIVDPELTKTCPKDLTITVGLDTLTHAMEGYLNTVQDPGNEDINERALMSIELVFRWLKVAAEEPNNSDARRMMALASVLGGTVIGGDRFKGTGGPHMNSFSWAETIAHGKSTGVMLPYYTVYYAKNPAVVDKLKPIAKMLNLSPDGDIGRNVAQAMLDWYRSMGFPTCLKDVKGWKEEYFQKALKDAGQNAMKLKAMPNPVPLEEVDAIIGPILEAAVSCDLTKIK
jgi:alcohol dehydrogenase/1,3-propanediol dehydrogenase